MMNRISSFFLLFLFCACSAITSRNDASIHFDQTEYDFGLLSYKKEAEFSFEFTNPGKTVLFIYDVTTSCGCTVAEWTKTPVKPGKTGMIKVKYDAAFPGVFHKEITVHYNGKNSPKILQIKGQVGYPDEIQTENNEK